MRVPRFSPSLIGVAVVASLTLAACGGTPAASGAAPDGEETSVFELSAGDCFTASGDQVETVEVVDCAKPHVYEAFAVLDHDAGPDDPYPGDDAILEWADQACQGDFEDFVGASYDTSKWYITSVTPSQETWDTGDREIVCTLNLEDQSAVSGSAEGSAE